ncbi:hypothetical protein Bbelb_231830 [Branchiostoma belcheri]|nr:hypothetical protein Bbelb_231830 [Branchiostoma belcheri]
MYHSQCGTGVTQPPDPTGQTCVVAQIIPPIENTAYHRYRNCNVGTAQQDSTNISLAQIVPPIPNTMYHRQRNAGFPQPPLDSTEICVAQIVPPIESTPYSLTPSSNAVASSRAMSASVSEREADCRRFLSSRPLPELPSAAGPHVPIDENTGEGTDSEHDYKNTHYHTYTV